jgi:hypothetical protein
LISTVPDIVPTFRSLSTHASKLGRHFRHVDREIGVDRRRHTLGVSGRYRVSDGVPQAKRTEPDAAIVEEFGADYADAFVISSSVERSAREWAWAGLRGAESAGGAFGRLVWGGVLGFRLARSGTPDTMVGWRLSTAEPDTVVLDADGRLMAGRMVFVVSGTDVTWTTMLRYHRKAAKRIWAVAGHAHRKLAPRCLDRSSQHFIRRSTQRASGSPGMP